MRKYGVTRSLALQVNSLHSGHSMSVQALVPAITHLEVIYLRLVRQTIVQMLQVNVNLWLSPVSDRLRIKGVETGVASLQTWGPNRNETSDNLSADRGMGQRC